MMGLVVRGAEVVGHTGIVDVRIEGEQIAAVSPGITPSPDDDVIEAAGGAVIPGLHDHHVHLLAWAAALDSIRCGPPDVTDRRALEHALRSAEPGPDGWIRGVGYHESVSGPLDRDALDDVITDRPVRIQHRSGMLWMLNAEALRRLDPGSGTPPGIERDATGRPTGRCWYADEWLHARLPPRRLDLGAVGRQLSRWGVTGVTDATVTTDADAARRLHDAATSGLLPQRLRVMGPVDLALPEDGSLQPGEVKIVLREPDLPELAEVVDLVAKARAADRGVAFHCVTRVELVFALAALERAGRRPGDRIEHGGVVPSELYDALRRLRLTVVTQPNFVAERGDDYLRDVEPADVPYLYPCARLIAAGVSVAAGTDAPFGGGDPWRAIDAARRRRTVSGAVLGEAERVDDETALGLFLGSADSPGGPARTVAVGMPADVCILGVPRASVLEAPDAARVAATIVGGEVIYRGRRPLSRTRGAAWRP
jgi:predicted amidohydrolase YtcJ